MSEDYDVFDNVFDMPTLMTINELRSEGTLQYIKSSLAAGKESKVYLAIAPDGSLLTVKIYLIVSAEFKKRMQYIAGDPRFSDLKHGSRSLRSEEHTSELQSRQYLVCRLLLEKK